MNDSGVHSDDFYVPVASDAPGIAPRGRSRDRCGDWMQTYSGKQFWPLDPRPEDIDIVDIAAALSKLNRYGGHTVKFYSVAEHCVLMTRAARAGGFSNDICFQILMHDASEAYLSDVIRPIKPYLDNYAEIETNLMRVIARRFRFEWPPSDVVKVFDNAILVDEMQQAMCKPPAPWFGDNPPRPLGVTLKFWSPTCAATEFLHEFLDLGGV